jgi:hypothetical protein
MTPAARLGLQQVVFGFINLAESYRGPHGDGTPAVGSQAVDEIAALDDILADDWSASPVRLAFAAAELHMRAAQDQLFGLGVLLNSSTEDALMTVARGTTEAAARASWLVDPEIDGRVRVSRTMTERLAGLYQELSLNDRLSRETDAPLRIDAIVQAATRHGMSVATDRNGRKYIGKDRHPGQTQAVELLFAHLGPLFGTRAYADLSAVAHSALAAFAAPKLLTVTEARPVDREPQLPIERGVIIATGAYDAVMRRFLRLYGWGSGRWTAFVAEAHAEIRRLIGVPPSLIDLVRVRAE